MKPDTIAVILKGYPRLSETFIAQELRGLEKAGFKLHLISLRHPTDKHTHPVHDEIEARVTYLPEYLHDEPLRVLKGWWAARKLPGYKKALSQFYADFKRDITRNRIRRFGQAMVLAAEMPEAIAHLHAHFIHTPASVTHYASLMTGLKWSFSAHAKDIWTSTDADLSGKFDDVEWAVTCTRNGWKHLQTLSKDPGKVHLSYHGLDLSRFGQPETSGSLRDGTDPSNPVELVTVCRAVEKKGLDVLMRSFATLPDDLYWRWVHIGAGGLETELKAQAESLGIAQHLLWRGALPQTDVLEQYRKSDLFVLPCRIAKNGDRDGLPNVIVEAQSQAIPVISTTVSGVPELVSDGTNGLLVDSENPEQLAEALKTLISNPDLRHKMGKAGEKIVRKHFDHIVSVNDLTDLFVSVGVKPQGY